MGKQQIVLPEDVLLEILFRSPVKSLIRFRCVSKSWFTLLKSPKFIDMHLKFSLARDDEKVLISRLITLSYKEIKNQLSLHCSDKSLSNLIPSLKLEIKNQLSIHSNDKSLSNFIPNLELHGYSDQCLYFAGSCHGIICFTTFRDDIILFNPAIREFRTLPPVPVPVERDQLHYLWKMINGMGFWFDPVSNDYKVVNIIAFEFKNQNLDRSLFSKAQIYNLSTDTWRELNVVLHCILLHTYDGSLGLFFNGKCHWQARNNRQEFILSMDVSTEIFHEFRLPGYPDQRGLCWQNSLLLIKDSLAVVSWKQEQMINIWVMKEYGVEESWSKQYSIRPFSSFIRPLPVWNNEKLLLIRKLQIPEPSHGPGKEFELVAWDALKNQFHKYDHIHGIDSAIGVVFYKETLLSITKNTT